MLFGLVVWFALPQVTHNREDNASWNEALRVLRHDYRLHQILLANFALSLIFFQLASTFGLYVTQLGFSAATYGGVISLNGALIVFCELPSTTITRRFPTRRAMAVGYILCALGYAANGLAHTVPALVL